MNQAEHYTKVAEALRDFRTYSVFNQLYIDQLWYWKERGTIIHNNSLAIFKDHLQYAVTIPWRSIPYEILIDCEGVELSYGNDIAVSRTLTTTLSSGLKIRCVSSVSIEIPPKELDTLRNLGKIHTEVIPAQSARIEESVFCPN